VLEKLKAGVVEGTFLTEWTSITDTYFLDFVFSSIDFETWSDVAAIHFGIGLDKLHLRFDILRFDVDHCGGWDGMFDSIDSGEEGSPVD
jgi:hypothetical protein